MHLILKQLDLRKRHYSPGACHFKQLHLADQIQIPGKVGH